MFVRERERESTQTGGAAGRGTEGKEKADSWLSREPDEGLHLRMLGSQPESKADA